MKIDLGKYKSGQIITSMSRRVFLELWNDIQTGVALERWPHGYEGQTKKERTEELRIRSITMLFQDHRDTFEDLLRSDEWDRIETYMGIDRMICVRAMLNVTERLERAKAIHRRYYRR